MRDSSQPIWMLEVSLLKLASLPPLQPLGALIARLESLERRLGLTKEWIRERDALAKRARFTSMLRSPRSLLHLVAPDLDGPVSSAPCRFTRRERAIGFSSHRLGAKNHRGRKHQTAWLDFGTAL